MTMTMTTTTTTTTTTTDPALIERVQIAHAAPMSHCRRLADLAVAALIDEVTLTPKPGPFWRWRRPATISAAAPVHCRATLLMQCSATVLLQCCRYARR